MSARHTPGPWEIDVRNGITARINGGNRLVANVIPSPALYQLAHFDRLLIAAAPEMLAALVVAREFISTDRNCLADASLAPVGSMHPDDAAALGDYDQALLQIDAAIAKATGGAA